MFRLTNGVLRKLRYVSCHGNQPTWRLKSSSARDAARLYKPGHKIHGFTVTEVVDVPDLFLTAVKLNHDETGAQFLHAARDDPNNLFSVQFRTTPMDSSGVPHILEHTVLCGSERFPCRDPFFRMLNRSLATFMNAFTASDYTMYPFSSQNRKDFQNLLSVYLDAVFFPCLRELDFWQEGWRLENRVPTDPESPLVFKGVVFNEMKGVFADNERLYSQHLQNRLYPKHTYSVVSGGDPLTIPDLTWSQLKEFHTTHYHPTNARFLTYGDLPLEQHLQQIQDEALCRFQRIQINTEVPLQPRWTCPREEHVTCSPDAMSPDPGRQDTLCVSFLLGDIRDTYEGFVLSLLASLMVSGPNAPFYKNLLEPELGTDFSSAVGYDGSTLEASFSVGLQGVARGDAHTVTRTISRTIDDIIRDGFPEERIEALLHKVEIQMKHQTTNFGLSLASYVASVWNHGGDPVELLRISDNVSRFRRDVKENPRFLQDKVRRYFKENPHRLTLTMSPDQNYLQKQQEAEDDKLQKKIQTLTQHDRREIYQKGLDLLESQSLSPDSSCLPALRVCDVNPVAAVTAVQTGVVGVVPVQLCQQPTNGLVYFRAVCSLNSLPEDLRPYVPLFCSVLTKMGSGDLDYRQQDQEMDQRTGMGSGDLDYRQQDQEMDLRTGDMSASPLVTPDSAHLDMYEQGVLLSSSCLDRNLPHMFRLWRDIFNSPRLEDEERLRVLLMMSAQELSNGISFSGHSYAMTRAGRYLTASGDLHELFSGMEQVKFMKRIAESSDLGHVLRTLPRIKKHLLNPENMRCAINATPEKMDESASQLETFMKDVALNRKTLKPVRTNLVQTPIDPEDESGLSRNLVSELNFQPYQMKTFFKMPFPVNFVSESIRTVPFLHQDYASLCVLARMMTAKFLHAEIREKGGAYGGGARTGGGLFTFYSYRDPNSVRTLSAFRGGVAWAKSGRFNQQDIDEAKLSVFSAVDAPVAPSSKGVGRFLSGVTDGMLQRHRERLFSVSHQDLVHAAERYLGAGQRTHGVAVLGPENKDINKDPSWILK